MMRDARAHGSLVSVQAVLFFGLSSFLLALMLFAVVFGATLVGIAIGRSQRHRSEQLREPFAALQAALLGVVVLLLAFGVAMAVGHYETRRALVTLLLLVTFDLDRPTRGIIRVPSAPLTALRASMELPPAATGPRPSHR